MERSTREHPMNSFQRILLEELSNNRHAHDSSVLAAIDDRIHNLELGTNAMQTLLRELGNLFWPDYYCYHKEEIGTRLMKLFLSRWSGLDLLMEELFADAQSHNSLIQKVPQDLSFQYYQTVLPEVGDISKLPRLC
ncbi:unnamed protein product [Clonostachys rosea f. rosea IK726]|uniref:Uncharacterized protein n=1 Tax=Clonostachys rosea f. rosea IK726 TaxID=1349383 RepID=A0ACA9TEL1_BIOOC|nr:unnamed protein product [Clonostachys rosea f. rosea IK726]